MTEITVNNNKCFCTYFYWSLGQNYEEQDTFCPNFDLLLGNLNGKHPISSIIIGNFNGKRCSSDKAN